MKDKTYLKIAKGFEKQRSYYHLRRRQIRVIPTGHVEIGDMVCRESGRRIEIRNESEIAVVLHAFLLGSDITIIRKNPTF